MSKFMNPRYALFDAYTPGEQPQDRKYIKLNTNESPYPPSQGVAKVLDREAADLLRLYPDPECEALSRALADHYGIDKQCVLCGNGSDELLSFAFMAWGGKGAAFADLSYGLYQVLADLHLVKAAIVPLRADFTLDDRDYLGLGKLIVIANPNAPTGMAILPRQIAYIAQQNPDSVVLVDEAYVDFGAASCLPLLKNSDNIVVVQTYSKSRSMAGARLGYAMGPAPLIKDLRKLKNAVNPYNVNRLTQLAGIAALEDKDYYTLQNRAIIQTREETSRALRQMGFEVLPSLANFVFAGHPMMGGEALYLALKKRGILVRNFSGARVKNFIRVSIGSKEQMAALTGQLREILGGQAS